MAQSFDSLTAAQIAAGVAAGDFTATEVAQASLAAIEAREGGVQAFLQVSPLPVPSMGATTPSPACCWAMWTAPIRVYSGT